ncbi:MAG: TetR/AcrR family transcriptional regulator [Gammaproteobacteria bacterium]|nr:TetR/AcrR family transcriptional regulator [Gammaproteobacteria bacterium]
MSTISTVKRRRGRPPKDQAGFSETKATLIRSGIEVLTEKGYSAAGIDEILKQVSIPKGSFYHYFGSKEAFGIELIKNYSAFFTHKLNKHLNKQSTLLPIQRLNAFLDDAKNGMERYHYKRGCLIGNLGQEMSALPQSFREQLKTVFEDWQSIIEALLKEAQLSNQISAKVDCKQSAYLFWIGWEGAVLRAKLEQTPDALFAFSKFYLEGLK